MSYTIITDSCCDFPRPVRDGLALEMVNLTLQYKGQTYTDTTDEGLKEMYDGLRAGESATTAAVNPQGWAAAIEPVLREGRDALVLAFSSGLSTTYQSAVIAAQELGEKYSERKITVVDTLCASLGQGLLVWYACAKQRDGMDMDALAAWCEEWKYRLCHWFTVDDLMYLKRGGRVSAATAVVGTMLNIKPVMHMDDEGHLIKVSTARGRKASIEALVKKMEELGLPGENETAFISHGDCIEDAQRLAAMIKERCGVKNVIIGYVGAVIGSHAGPGVLALFFLGKNR